MYEFARLCGPSRSRCMTVAAVAATSGGYLCARAQGVDEGAERAGVGQGGGAGWIWADRWQTTGAG
jgi:hypothetical protein